MSFASTTPLDPLSKYALSYMKVSILKWAPADFDLLLFYCSGNSINDAEMDHIPIFRHLIKSHTFIREIQQLTKAGTEKLTCQETIKALEKAYYALEADNANGWSNLYLSNCNKITEEMLKK